jgi:hypothetical protein
MHCLEDRLRSHRWASVSLAETRADDRLLNEWTVKNVVVVCRKLKGDCHNRKPPPLRNHDPQVRGWDVFA